MNPTTKVTAPTSHHPHPPTRGLLAMFRRASVLGLALSVPLLLSACAGIQSLVEKLRPASGGHVIAVNADLWTLNFQPSPDVAEDAPIIKGSLLIQKRGQMVQTIEHSLNRDTLRAKDDSWLLVVDVNNDGLPDFLLTHALATSESSPTKSLYLFDAQSQTFQLQKQLSKLGDIDKLSGCVVVTASSKEKSSPRTYCFSEEKTDWMEVKLSPSNASVRCNTQTHSQADCRGLRNQRDGEMRNLVNSYIASKTKSMVEDKRKTAAQRFARNLRIGHDQWLLYRDARCASYVIEYNFSPNTSGFEMESCKLDLSSLQLQHYASMLASLDR